MNKARILYVDDELGNCKWFVKIMQRKGYDVEFADSIQGALRILELDSKFDVLISDYLFENSRDGKNGIDLIDEVDIPGLQKIVITAFTNIGSNHVHYKVLHKPVDYDELSELIDRQHALG